MQSWSSHQFISLLMPQLSLTHILYQDFKLILSKKFIRGLHPFFVSKFEALHVIKDYT